MARIKWADKKSSEVKFIYNYQNPSSLKRSDN